MKTFRFALFFLAFSITSSSFGASLFRKATTQGARGFMRTSQIRTHTTFNGLCQLTGAITTRPSKEDEKALIQAARLKHYDEMKRLLGNGISPNCWTRKGKLLLKRAVEELDPKAVLLLRHYGAEKNLRNLKGEKLNAEEVLKAQTKELGQHKGACEKEKPNRLLSKLAVTRAALNHKPKRN